MPSIAARLAGLWSHLVLGLGRFVPGLAVSSWVSSPFGHMALPSAVPGQVARARAGLDVVTSAAVAREPATGAAGGPAAVVADAGVGDEIGCSGWCCSCQVLSDQYSVDHATKNWGALGLSHGSNASNGTPIGQARVLVLRKWWLRRRCKTWPSGSAARPAASGIPEVGSSGAPRAAPNASCERAVYHAASAGRGLVGSVLFSFVAYGPPKYLLQAVIGARLLRYHGRVDGPIHIITDGQALDKPKARLAGDVQRAIAIAAAANVKLIDGGALTSLPEHSVLHVANGSVHPCKRPGQRKTRPWACIHSHLAKVVKMRLLEFAARHTPAARWVVYVDSDIVTTRSVWGLVDHVASAFSAMHAAQQATTGTDGLHVPSGEMLQRVPKSEPGMAMFLHQCSFCKPNAAFHGGLWLVPRSEAGARCLAAWRKAYNTPFEKWSLMDQSSLQKVDPAECLIYGIHGLDRDGAPATINATMMNRKKPPTRPFLEFPGPRWAFRPTTATQPPFVHFTDFRLHKVEIRQAYRDFLRPFQGVDTTCTGIRT